MAASIPPGTNLWEMPIVPPPPGVKSNFIDPPTEYPMVLAINLIMMVWAIAFVGVRLFMKGRRMDIGDWCCVIGLILSMAYSVLEFTLNLYPRHQWDIPMAYIMQPSFVKVGYAIALLSGPGASLAKISIFILYLQLFKVSKAMRIAIYAGIVFNILLYWPFVIVTAYYCVPTAGQSQWLAPNSTCGRLEDYTITQGAAIVALDLYIFILPLSMIFRLQLSPAKKLASLAVFMTASLGIVAGIFGMTFRIVENFKDSDVTWVQAQLAICLSVENYVAVIVSCAPAISGFTKQHLLPTKLGQHVRSRLLERLGITLSQRSPSSGVEKSGAHQRNAGSAWLNRSAPARMPNHDSTATSTFNHEHQVTRYAYSEDLEKQGDGSDHDSNQGSSSAGWNQSQRGSV